MSAQDLIAYTARVSNPANQMNMETAPKLLAYLIKNKHWSPFEMAHMTVEIKTSRAIAQQILRHRSFSFQEFSQRYAKATAFVNYEARRQDDKNRQNSIDDMSEADKQWFADAQTMVQDFAKNQYEEALNRGIAKEQARFLLPLSTETTLYMCGSVRSWMHYLELRCANGTQKEHKDIADGIKSLFNDTFPDIGKALGWLA
jgi:thymidylate synthase (FAD)